MTLPTSGPLTFSDIQTEFGGTNPIALNEYYAGGGLVPAGTSGTYGAVPSSGQISVQNFYGTTAFTPVYIEEVFSTYLYTGNGSTQTITNGIDLSTNGGLVWIKNRTAYSHALFDTSRGVENLIKSNTTEAQSNLSGSLTSFTTSGFSLGSAGIVNDGSGSYPNNVSWTFREQPKFFDIVTYTGNGTNGRTVAHSLGSTPGCIIVKRTDASNGWAVYHRAMNASPQDYMMRLNATDAAFTTSPSRWNNTLPTSTEFTLSGNDEVNGSGATYVAYLFAHNAGGFGLSGTDNVISCGSYVGSDTTSTTVTLGYEPQWVMIKRATGDTSDFTGWAMFDTMRGMPVSGNDNTLLANTSNAENPATANGAFVSPTATGFTLNVAGSNLTNTVNTYIYIAIRRGPMKAPTVGTQVYNAVLRTGTGVDATVTGAVFPPDLVILEGRTDPKGTFSDRLRGSTRLLNSYETAAEATDTLGVTSFSMDGMAVGTGNNANQSGMPYVYWFLRRYPSVFDEVCYTGTGTSDSSINHNLGVVPELFIVKRRNAGGSGDVNWGVYSKDRPSIAFNLILNSTTGWYNAGTNGWFGTGTLSSTLFPSGNASANFGNLSGGTYVAYLFATCPGVSKVGSYTGTGALQTVNCGFTTGARWVMVKRTDSTGDWYVWDSTRGITSGNDPYLLLNANVAEVTGTNYVDTDTTGFKVTAAAPAGINANGGTYIFLAIA